MDNVITLNAQDVGSFLGPIASRYAYTPALRKRITECLQAAKRGSNRGFALEGVDVRAAGSVAHATGYLQPGYVLLVCELPDVGEPLRPTADEIEEAKRAWQYFPFRLCYLAVKAGEQRQIILKPTAHRANRLARDGWTVLQLRREQAVSNG